MKTTASSLRIKSVHFHRRMAFSEGTSRAIARRYGFLVAIGLAAGGLNCQADTELLAASSEEDALKMELTVLKQPGKDLSGMQLQLKVTNTSTNNLVLDKELAAGFSLRFRTDLSDENVKSEERDVCWKEVSRFSKPSSAAASKRFVVLRPGKSLSRKYDLSKPVHSVIEGHSSDKNMVHRGFYYEATVRYAVPAGAKKVLIDAWYDRGVWMMATPQFQEWHGRSAQDLGVWDGRANSNTVSVERKSQS